MAYVNQSNEIVIDKYVIDTDAATYTGTKGVSVAVGEIYKRHSIGVIVKLYKLLILFIFLITSSITLANPPKTCIGAKGFNHFDLSATNIDDHFVPSGSWTPTRFLRCNYTFRKNEDQIVV